MTATVRSGSLGLLGRFSRRRRLVLRAADGGELAGHDPDADADENRQRGQLMEPES